MEEFVIEAGKELKQIENQIIWINNQLDFCDKKTAKELRNRLQIEQRRLKKWDEKYGISQTIKQYGN